MENHRILKRNQENLRAFYNEWTDSLTRNDIIEFKKNTLSEGQSVKDYITDEVKTKHPQSYYKFTDTIDAICKRFDEIESKILTSNHYVIDFNENGHDIPDLSGQIIDVELLNRIRYMDIRVNSMDNFGYLKFYISKIENGQRANEFRVDIGDGDTYNGKIFDDMLQYIKENPFVYKDESTEKTKYVVTIEEILSRDIEIEATSREEALQIAEARYDFGEIILDADDLKHTAEFTVQEIEPDKEVTHEQSPSEPTLSQAIPAQEIQEESQPEIDSHEPVKQIKLNPSQEKLVKMVKESLDKNIIPWQQPWENHFEPVNAITEKRYKGYNHVALSMAASVRGFKDPRWCTFNQAKDKNWRIKKGAKSVQLFYPLLYNHDLKKHLTEEDFASKSDEEIKALKAQSTLRVKYFSVFNGEEIIGIPKLKENDYKVPFSNKIAQEISDNIQKEMAIHISHEGDRAFYNIASDSITMPNKEQFKAEEVYYGTLYHELSHATGSKDRLNRNLTGSFGSASYAEEELIAEFSSLFLSQELGLHSAGPQIENNAAYIQSWHKLLEEDPSILIRSINGANDAYHYLREAGKVKEYEAELQSLRSKNLDTEVSLETLKRDVLITDYAEVMLGMKLDPKGRGMVSTKEHDSLMIYTESNDFYRFSTATGGSIIDFVMHFEDVDLQEALNRVRDYYHQHEPEAREYKPKSKRNTVNINPLDLPEPAEDNNKVIAYLTKTRGLPVGVVNDFIHKGLLYQDKQDNCVFVGKLDNVPLFATRRAAKKSSGFKADVATSINEVGVFYKNDADTLILTESVIDTMSLITMQSGNKNYDYLSVNGLGKAKNVLYFHMMKRPEDAQKYERIVIAFDNDKAGEVATHEMIDYINAEFPDIDVHHSYPNGKDWNDDLVSFSKKHEDLSHENEAPRMYMGMSR